MASEDQFMLLAIKQGTLAKKSGELPFGAVIVSGKKVVAKNRCSELTDKNVLSHAELKAVSDACITLKETI